MLAPAASENVLFAEKGLCSWGVQFLDPCGSLQFLDIRSRTHVYTCGLVQHPTAIRVCDAKCESFFKSVMYVELLIPAFSHGWKSSPTRGGYTRFSLAAVGLQGDSASFIFIYLFASIFVHFKLYPSHQAISPLNLCGFCFTGSRVGAEGIFSWSLQPFYDRPPDPWSLTLGAMGLI